MHSSDTLSPPESHQSGQDHDSGRRDRSSTSRKHPRRRFLLGGAAVLGLAATGTSAWALNRFVIEHVEVDDVTALEAKAQKAAGSSATPATNVTVGDNSASEHDAILAINGDYYGFRSDGILIRNGVIYRDSGTRDGMAFYSDGRVEVYDETTTKAQTLLDAGVWNTLSFGPALVNNSKVLSGIDQVEVDTNVGNHSIQGKQPRTAVGWVETNHLKLVVVDGRNEGYSRGVTMSELAQIMADLGCACAYNIDGGGSSAMYFNGSIINQPSNGGERDTSDILYIANGA